MSSTVAMYEINVCFITEGHILIWNPITFSLDVNLWQTIRKLVRFKWYYHISIRVLHLITKLMSAVNDQGEGVFMVKHPIIWYLWKALNVLCTGHPDLKLCHWHPVSQTRLKPSPGLKCKSELFQLKETCTDWSVSAFVLSQDAHQ